MNTKLPASFLDIHNTSVVYFLYPLNLFALCTRMKICAVFKPSDGKDNGKLSKTFWRTADLVIRATSLLIVNE